MRAAVEICRYHQMTLGIRYTYLLYIDLSRSQLLPSLGAIERPSWRYSSIAALESKRVVWRRGTCYSKSRMKWLLAIDEKLIQHRLIWLNPSLTYKYTILCHDQFFLYIFIIPIQTHSFTRPSHDIQGRSHQLCTSVAALPGIQLPPTKPTKRTANVGSPQGTGQLNL